MLNLHSGEGHISMCLPAVKAPYRKHLLTLSRGATGRLKVEIESFMPGEQGPSRVEMGPLHQMARTLSVRYHCDAKHLISNLERTGYSARLMAEVEQDLALPVATPELEGV
jgi:hypothetical protein